MLGIVPTRCPPAGRSFLPSWPRPWRVAPRSPAAEAREPTSARGRCWARRARRNRPRWRSASPASPPRTPRAWEAPTPRPTPRARRWPCSPAPPAPSGLGRWRWCATTTGRPASPLRCSCRSACAHPCCSPRAPTCPGASADAIDALRPTGARTLGGAQVIRIGDAARASRGREVRVRGANPYALAQQIDRLQSTAAGKSSDRVVIASGEQAQFAMPAAAWAAKSGDPVLFVRRNAIPPETRAALRAHQQPKIYVLGPPTVISNRVVDRPAQAGSRASRQRPRPRRPTRSPSLVSWTASSVGV